MKFPVGSHREIHPKRASLRISYHGKNAFRSHSERFLYFALKA